MLATNGKPPKAAAPRLTEREMMIVSLMGLGHNTLEIATLLELSPRTVENHKRHLYGKLDVGSQGQALAKAIQLGLFQPGQLHAPLAPLPGQPHDLPEPGRATLAVLIGPPGEGRDEVARVLVSERIPFVTVLDRGSLGHDHWVLWHRGPVVVVLASRQPADWSVARTLQAPTVVVLGRDVPEKLAIADAIARKASGLVAEADVATDLVPTLAAVAQGLLVTSWRYAQSLLKCAPAPSLAAPEFTARECEILASIARGHTVRQTARALGIANKTVENIQTRMFRKLGARNRMDALMIADSMGIIDRIKPDVAQKRAPALNSST